MGFQAQPRPPQYPKHPPKLFLPTHETFLQNHATEPLFTVLIGFSCRFPVILSLPVSIPCDIFSGFPLMHSLETFVMQRCKQLGITRKEFAARAGLSRETLYRLMRGEIGRATIDTVYRFAKAAQVAPIHLMRLVYQDFDLGAGTVLKTRYPNDHQSFIRDVTIPDNVMVGAGQPFTKVWEVQNTGAVVWENRVYRCIDDDVVLARQRQDGSLEPLLGVSLIPAVREVPCPTVKPGETVQVTVEFKAPQFPCSTLSLWKMFDKEGEPCFPEHTGLWCKVHVVGL